jgi:hypothetical protein
MHATTPHCAHIAILLSFFQSTLVKVELEMYMYIVEYDVNVCNFNMSLYNSASREIIPVTMSQ